MAIKKITYTEEIKESKRVASMNFDDTTGKYIRPDNILTPEAIAQWDRIMTLLANITESPAIKHGNNGENLTCIINPVLLADYCMAIAMNKPMRQLGT